MLSQTKPSVHTFVALAIFAVFGLVPTAFAQIPTHSGPFRFIDPLATMAPACDSDDTCYQEADKYLHAIGVYDQNNQPTAVRGTSSAWKASLGFSPDPTKPNPGELRAVYWNAGDLELGRDMHCISHQEKSNVGRGEIFLAITYACYVTNYREDKVNTIPPGRNAFSGTPDVSLSISEAAHNLKPVATVAMEVTLTPLLVAISRPGRRLLPPPGLSWSRGNVQFIAFDETAPNNGRAFSPELDSQFNPKSRDPVNPNLAHKGLASPGTCLNCHGGRYVGSTEVGGARVEGGNFLPFNTSQRNFTYTTDPTLSRFSETQQREVFRQLNEFVKQTQPTVPTITALIDGWYAWCGGVRSPGCFSDDVAHPFLPNTPAGTQCGTSATDRHSQTCGWATGESAINPEYKPSSLTGSVYQKVASQYCRTCHVALPQQKNVEQFNDWRGLLGLVQEIPPQVPTVVSEHEMPQAEVPFKNYWNDHAAQDSFDSFFNPNPSPCAAACLSSCRSTCTADEQSCTDDALSFSQRQKCVKTFKECNGACVPQSRGCINACAF